MKVSILALFAAPALVLGSLAPQSGPAAVAHHHQNVARGIKAHPASHYHGKRGPAKPRRCAAKTASLSSASVSSTSVLAHQTTTTTKKETTTTKKPEEKTTTTTKPHTTTTTAKPKPTADNNDDNNSGSGETYTGDATFYSTGLNACGTYDSDDDFIAAVAHANFDSFPGANGNSNENPICNKKVNACWEGKCVTVRITDRCGGCAWGALDFSPAAFKQLASFDVGRLHGMTWHFL